MKKSFICKTEAETTFLAQQFAHIAKKGDIFALYGTLGVGKSTFSRSFIQALCSVNDVPSPTFTLVQTYEAPDFEIYHYDMYRLKRPEDAYELDIEEAFYSGVSLIEWPEKIGYLLPKNIWKINISSLQEVRTFEVDTISEEKLSRLEEITVA
jgi:tRNA threonylcarbamoyladenosine biosynthesis protein TsaE